jgi:hypothetical protein
MYSVTSIRNDLTYPHYSKEIIQAIEFCKGISNIPLDMTQHAFRSGILGKHQIGYSRFYNEFNSTELFVIEIASRISYTYKGLYVHHILTEPQYGFNDMHNIVQRDLSDDEIEEDVLKMRDLLYPKKMMIVGHIYTRTTGKRYELVKLLERICVKHNIPFFDPVLQLNGKDSEKLYVKEGLLAHYTPYGHSEIGQKYTDFINRIK